MANPIGELYADKYEILQAILEYTLPSYDEKGRKLGGFTIEEACRKVGISQTQWYKMLGADASYKKLYEDAKTKRKEILIDKAMSNVEDAIYGREKLRPIDKVNVSMRYLEKTSPDFKDKVELEVNGDITSESLEELLLKAKELTKSLSINKDGDSTSDSTSE